jgi:hypothetical protein
MDLLEEGISPTSLLKFLECRERFRIYKVEKLVPMVATDALSFGGLFHDMLDIYTEGKTKAAVLRYLTQRMQGKDQQAQYDARVCYTVFEAYLERYAELDRDRHYLGNEEAFKVPCVLPSGRRINLKGRMDQVFRKNGKIILQETKTKSRIDKVLINHSMPLNLQTMFYVYCYEKKHGKLVDEVLYNVIRRPQSRQGKKETFEDFLTRLRDDMDKRSDTYFYRHTTELSPPMMETFLYQVLFPALEQLCMWWESIRHSPFDPWKLPDGSANPHHWIRPFGVYDSFKYGKGDYFDKIVLGTNIGLTKSTHEG